MAPLLLAFLCGAGFHAVLVAVALGPWAIARSSSRRIDLRPAMKRRPYAPPESAGVRVFRDNPPRMERAPAPLTSFDEEASHGG